MERETNLFLQNKTAFDRYYDLLVFWNERFNLTAITQKEEVEIKHFIDSLASEELIEKNSTVLDIGSGAGFPSIPLKIVREDIDLTMVDSVNKKVGFLNEIISKLNLKNAVAIHSRAEDLNKDKKYDFVVSRAVASLSTLLEYCLPFVKEGGYLIAYKSEKTDEEILESKNALAVLGGSVEKVIDKSHNGLNRKLIVVKKIAPTPSKYPRGKNLPRVKPL